jgi:hypothetical protein
MALIMSLKGLDFCNSEIELYDDRITVKDFMLPRHETPVKDIVKVWYFARAGFLSPGILNFSARDEKGRFKTEAIHFNTGGAREVEKLRLLLEDMRKGGRPRVAQPEAVAAPPQVKAQKPPEAPSGADELEKLAGLKAKGIITEDEFQMKKRQLLFGGKDGTVFHEKEIIKEIVKVPCAYCGVLMDITSTKCPTCGAPVSRR